MNSGIRRIEEVIDYIEEHIEEDIDHTLLASKMTLSLYEFRRIFSFIVGCPLSDYLRKRRLSLAACELVSSQKSSIRSISEKFGYSTEAAFSKAFKEHHGISPTQCQRGDGDIRLFTRPEFEFTVSGRSTVPFRIISDTAFKVDGIKMVSPYSDTSCCDAVWTKFYDDGYDGNIKSDKIYATYLSCSIKLNFVFSKHQTRHLLYNAKKVNTLKKIYTKIIFYAKIITLTSKSKGRRNYGFKKIWQG